MVIEKPFGHDPQSAKELNAIVNRVFPRSSVFRIDHYLSKKRTAEHSGAGSPTNCSIRCGARTTSITCRSPWPGHRSRRARRILRRYRRGPRCHQNHLLQLMALVAMEEFPISFEPKRYRPRRSKFWPPPAISSPWRKNTAGQYGPGWQGSEPVPGLIDEDGFAADSITETYAASPWRSIPDAGRCRSIFGPEKRLGRRSPRSHWCSSEHPSAVRQDDDRGAEPERSGDPGAAGRGASPSRFRLQGTRIEHEVRDVNMDFSLRHAFTEASPGLRA